jgi:anti-sigma regulatory factor (Ser/Thr protein kinase)
MEIDRSSYEIRLTDDSQVGHARRTAIKLAELLHLAQDRVDAAALIATEMATNLINHAKDGSIVAQVAGINGTLGLQLLAIDKGPGIKDVTAALCDGWTSNGTLGGGFGTMRRLSNAFDLYTQPTVGTVVLSEIWRDGKDPGMCGDMRLGVISTRYPGEEFNGDGWVVQKRGDLIFLVVVDGLGHGALASDAAREAERIIQESSSNSPNALLEDCHKALAKTRGAAIGIAALRTDGGLLTFAGIGNIAGSISTEASSRALASHNGTSGHVVSRLQEFTYPWSPESLLVIHSDGISMRWNLTNYAGIRSKHPSIIAAVVHRDFSRPNDDSTILVASQSRA